jgi:hypothetical protein
VLTHRFHMCFGFARLRPDPALPYPMTALPRPATRTLKHMPERLYRRTKYPPPVWPVVLPKFCHFLSVPCHLSPIPERRVVNFSNSYPSTTG